VTLAIWLVDGLAHPPGDGFQGPVCSSLMWSSSVTCVGVSTSDRGGRRVVADVRQSGRSQKVALLAKDDVSRRRLAGILAAGGFGAVTRVADIDELPIDAEAVVIAGGNADVVRDVRRARPESVIVSIATDSDPRAVRVALDAGVDGIVPEQRAERALAPAVAAAIAGLVTLPRETRGHSLRPALSSREKQVLGMVVLGLSNGEIARKLHLAETTVKSHLSSSFRKLGVRSRSQAAALVLDGGNGLGLGILSLSDGVEE
jgi:DNA-binding NarL/FixJ family response regulator